MTHGCDAMRFPASGRDGRCDRHDSQADADALEAQLQIVCSERISSMADQMSGQMAEETRISDLITGDLDTIEASETVRAATRRMESQTLRSLIVVNDDRPVGVVKWRDLRNADVDSPVSAYMVTDFPVLRNSMDITEAHGHLGGVDFDHIPVVNEDGQLIGEVPRGAIVHHETSSEQEDRVTVNGDPVIETTRPSFDLRADMDVVDVEGSKLGKVTEITNDPTTHRLSQVLVEHGLLRKKHKRIPTDTIKDVSDDTVVLAISKMEWDFLTDVEDEGDL